MFTVHADGLCEPYNPGGTACYGWVVHRDGQKLAEGYGKICSGPDASNNVAEYGAVIAAMEWLLEHEYQEEKVRICSDSQLCIYQLQGIYQVHSPRIRPLYKKAKGMERQFKSIRFSWVPREQNEEADALSRRAYGETTGRAERALALVNGVRLLAENQYAVASQSGNGEYLVDMTVPSCTCPDYAKHRKGHKCKHILAVEFATSERTA